MALNGLSKNTDDLVSEESTLQNNQLCRRCKKSAAHFVCSRCDDFYCSEICQNMDWEQHRYICKSKPRLVEINSAESKREFKELKETISSLAHCYENLAKHLNQFDISNYSKVLSPKINDRTNNLNNYTTTDKSQKQHHTDMDEDLSNKKLNKEDELILLISFVNSSRVAICSKNNYIEYNEVLKEVDTYGKTAPSLQCMPNFRENVIISKFGMYCRAKVISIKNEDEVFVVLTDYGIYTYRKFVDIRQITHYIIKLPEYVAVARLKNVKNYKLNKTISEYMNNFRKELFKMKSFDNNTEIELFDIASGNSINEQIEAKFNGYDLYQKLNPNKPQKITNENSTIVQNETASNAKPQPLLVAPFNMILFSHTLHNAEAFIVDTTLIERGYIGCILEQHIDEISDIQIYLNDNNNHISDIPYVPQAGEYVIAYFGNEWLRGKVLSLSADESLFEIGFIDFTIKANISSENVRRYPNDLTIDCHTQLCLLDGLPKTFSPKLKKFLKSEITLWGQITINRVVSVLEEEVALIECNQILDQMFEQNIF